MVSEMDAFERRVTGTLLWYADDVSSAVDAAAVAHRAVLEHPRTRARRLALPWTLRSVPALAWLVLLGLVVTSLIATALFIGSRPESPITESLPRHPGALVPTGVEWVAPESSPITAAVADGSGTVWALAVLPVEVNGTPIGDVLVRIDPSGAVRTWTFADDAAFRSAVSIVPAGGGGVWLVPSAESAGELRWFDGERFRDVVPAPPGGPDHFAEAPDGSLWSGTASELFHWDGTSWSASPEGRPVAGVAGLAVDRNGAVWVGNCDYDAAGACSEGGISRFDGTRWETFTNVAASWWIGAGPDGSVWAAGGGELARYDGHAWRLVQLPAAHTGWFALAADGTVWATQCAYAPLDNLVTRYDGGAWVTYTSAGLPPRLTTCRPIVATAHGVYVGTDGDGLYQLVGDRWERVWPQP